MKIITIEALKTFLDELNKKYGTEFYSRKEIDDKLKELSKTSGYTQEKADAMMQEIARRVPNYQYEVKITQKPHQTITATAGDKTYTDTFLIERGAKVSFSLKPNPGYIAGTLSMKNCTVTKDMEVTVTEAIEPQEVLAGTKTFSKDYEDILVPPKVHVLKWTWNGKDLYTRVMPKSYVDITTAENNKKYEITEVDAWFFDGYIPEGEAIDDEDERFTQFYSDNIFSGFSSEPLTVSWSTEINAHLFEYDWTEPMPRR